jgi:hypothetical protein
MTYQGRNGKQHVVITAAGNEPVRPIANTADESADESADAPIAFALPDPDEPRTISEAAEAPRKRLVRQTHMTGGTESSRPPLPDGEGK